ncbi:GtrA family protein [Robertmurraya kyonggiensis]|uniref:GtrA family protein n=1 Tax=Robertmurraya kyonggiensis TaxID=1037680 RepID=UPI001FE959E8|nr:GtrA family protein [Robertmurraya kyonggiensis]
MKDNNFLGQGVRFVIIGFINTGNYYLLYLLFFVLLNFHYMIAHILSFLISMVGSFFLNSYYTYKTKPTLKKFLQFPLTYIVNVIVTTTAIYILTEIVKLDGKITPLLASGIAIPFTFLISKKILADKSISE